MKFYTSYFYQIRNFTPNMIPLSTACGDPLWFHKGMDNGYTFFDKNGVISGLRAEMLHPDNSCSGLCEGMACPETPDNCLFLQRYRTQLSKVDFIDFLERCDRIARIIQSANNFEGEPIIVLIVHEAINNPCSERKVLQEWMMSHGILCEELPYKGKQFKGFQ